MQKIFFNLFIISLFFLIFMNDFAHGIQLTENISEDIVGMRKNYSHWSGSLPLGDINRDCIGNVTKEQRLIFSESVSYALFSHALQINGEDEEAAKEKFLTYWDWTKNNLIRKNIHNVFSWNYDSSDYHTWISMPEVLIDDLMSWRWVEIIEDTDQSGIIYQTSNEQFDPGDGCASGDLFMDGSQVASDGDLLTAYALYLAYKRGWGDELLNDAKLIIQDIRKKIVVDFEAGEMVNAQKIPMPNNIFSGTFYDGEVDGTIELLDESGVFAWQGKNNYLGFWHEPLLDLSNLNKIIVTMKGTVSPNHIIDFRIQDVVNGQDVGHIYTTSPIQLTSQLISYEFGPKDFEKYPYYGAQEGELDWSTIKNLQFQVSMKPDEYYPYFGTYNDDGEGNISIIDISNKIAFKGNRCYYGFSYAELLNLSDLKRIRIRLKGTKQGKVDFRIIEGKVDDPNFSSTVYYTGNIILKDDYETYVFTKNSFIDFPYDDYDDPLDWSKIRNVQFQVSSNNDTYVEIEFVEIELNDGTIYIIQNITDDIPTYAAVESIKIVLTSGQTEENNGYHVYANAHGAAYMNPSYFMPFAYRVFKEIDDPEGAELWDSLLNETYDDLNKSLELTLHDLVGNDVVNKGHLFPNWYQIDQLSGEAVDVVTQKESSNVRGYKFGYDAFRTIWFIAYDYFLNTDIRNKELLEKIYPFFRDEMINKERICPVYKNDETIEEEDSDICEIATPFGFYAVYLNLFLLMNDLDHVNAILDIYSNERRASDDGRVWLNSTEEEMDRGETEYFMNFWSLFGLYLYDNLKNTSIFNLVVENSGNGSGTIADKQGQINCGDDCEGTYFKNNNSELTATAASDSVFISWTGCDSTNGTTCNVTMNADKTITAQFNKRIDVTIKKGKITDKIKENKDSLFVILQDLSGVEESLNNNDNLQVNFSLSVQGQEPFYSSRNLEFNKKNKKETIYKYLSNDNGKHKHILWIEKEKLKLVSNKNNFDFQDIINTDKVFIEVKIDINEKYYRAVSEWKVINKKKKTKYKSIK